MIKEELLSIRPEKHEDFDSVFQINLHAFETDAEALLVQNLREKDILFLSLVAEYQEKIIGHILFTPVNVEINPERIRTIGLAPMAVLPDYQRQGVGSQLVRHGIELCKQNDQEVVFVLGHADYYPRFGFIPARSCGLFYHNDFYDPYFFVKELKKNVFEKIRGEVIFDPAFDVK